MSNATKKRARDLQRITGMPYQSAHRAVSNGTEHEASIRSGLNLNDFVTPREQRIWHLVNGTGAFDCVNGRHWMPQEVLGQCVSCGTYLVQSYDDDGDTYETAIDEQAFLDDCAAAGTYYNWAPPLAHLDGQTQAEYFWRTNPAVGGAMKSDPSRWDLEWAANPDALTRSQVGVLQAIKDLAVDSPVVGTRAVSALLSELGKIDLWGATNPWHGTNPAASQLREAGLITVHVGIARMHAPGEPAEEVGQYGLELTEPGLRALTATVGA